MSNVLISY